MSPVLRFAYPDLRLYKELLAEQKREIAEMKAEHKQEIAAKDKEISELNRMTRAAEARLGDQCHAASSIFSGTLPELLSAVEGPTESTADVPAPLVGSCGGGRSTCK